MPSFRKPTPEAIRRIIAAQASLKFTYPEVGATAKLPFPLPGSDPSHGAGAPDQTIEWAFEVMPSSAQLDSPVDTPADDPPLYPSPASQMPLPGTYALDHNRNEIGRGEVAFERRAKAALMRWKQFQLGWLEAFPDDTPLRTGETVAVVARAGGLWWVNVARIVYTIDEPAAESTLPLPRSALPLSSSRFGFAYGTLPCHVESGEERFLIEWDHATDAVYFDILAFSRPRHLLVRLNRRRARAMQKRFAAEATEAMRRAVVEDGG